MHIKGIAKQGLVPQKRCSLIGSTIVNAWSSGCVYYRAPPPPPPQRCWLSCVLCQCTWQVSISTCLLWHVPTMNGGPPVHFVYAIVGMATPSIRNQKQLQDHLGFSTPPISWGIDTAHHACVVHAIITIHSWLNATLLCLNGNMARVYTRWLLFLMLSAVVLKMAAQNLHCSENCLNDWQKISTPSKCNQWWIMM